ncbi:MAG: AgmX/PglI C-terminal domain-containing protein [Bdellovibrionales bacterium]|nr:AgmX/PglI C-terminal domain-containing protein [Bdellovibrionales bacterium]
MKTRSALLNTVVFFALIFSLAALYYLLPLYNLNPPPSRPVVGEIKEVQGSSPIFINKDKIIGTLTAPIVLHTNDEVSVGPASFALIKLLNGDQFKVLPGAKINIELYSQDNPKSPTYVFVENGLIENSASTSQLTNIIFNHQLFLLNEFKNQGSKILKLQSNKKQTTKALTLSSSHSLLPENVKLSLKDKLEQLIASKQEKIEHCFLNRIKDIGHVQGLLLLGMTIKPNGKITDVKPIRTQIKDKEMISCISSVISRLTPPEFEGEDIYFSYSFSFE